MPRFSLPKFDTWEKELEISTDDFRCMIDYDDVSHGVVKELTKLVVKHLNAIPNEQWKAAILRGTKHDQE